MSGLFEHYGFTSGGVLNLTPKEAYELCLKGAIIIDVREEYLTCFKLFNVTRVAYLPNSMIRKEYSALSKNDYLILADSVGLRSREAGLFLKEKGYKKIANMAGGISDWEREGLPLKINIEEKLTGSCMCQLKKRIKIRDKK